MLPLSQRERGSGRDGEFAEHVPRPSSGSGVLAGTRPAREGEMEAIPNIDGISTISPSPGFATLSRWERGLRSWVAF